jgi:predicted nuclease of predicted toxin-antitoxin system
LERQKLAVFLADECIGRRTISLLRHLNHRVVILQRLGLRSASDELVLKEAIRRKAVLITADHDFADLLRYPLSSHDGIIVVRWSRQRESVIHAVLHRCLTTIPAAKLRHTLVTVDQFGFRLVHPQAR